MDSSFKEIKSVNGELALFLFGEEGLVFSELSKRLYLLNALGIFIWLQLEEGLDGGQIRESCADQGIDFNDDLETLFQELSDLFQSGKLGEVEDSESDSWLKKIDLNKAIGHAQYRIMDLNFSFEFSDKEIEDLWRPLLVQFETFQNNDPKEDCSLNISNNIFVSVFEEADGQFCFKINEYLFSWKVERLRVVSFLLDRVRKIAFTFSEYQLAAHAAVLAQYNQCILFPAASYSGKSTLSAALVSKGYQYLSDEIAVFDKDYRVRPFPLSLGLKAGSWDVLEHFDLGLNSSVELERWDGVAMKYLAVAYESRNGDAPKGLELSQERREVSHLVFPRYVAGETASLSEISAPQALYELFQAGYTESMALDLSSCRELLEWLNGLERHRFVFDDLGAATQCLSEMHESSR